MNVVNWQNLDEQEKQKFLARPAQGDMDLSKNVSTIIASVRELGDLALFEYSHEFDQVELNKLQVTQDEFVAARNQVDNKYLIPIKTAINRIENYQRACFPKEIVIDTQDGIICKRIPTAIEKVGLYVPGGSAPLISTVMMLAVPAKLARCSTRILCTPPRSDGSVNPYILLTAELCGISTIYKIGGAQAIAAMAYGTESISKVDKIFGPGNAWVTEAKQQVAQDVNGASIDSPAGPSEVLVIADENANPEIVAADLLSQAEHGPDSQVILITNSSEIAEQVKRCIIDQLGFLSRKSIVRKSLKNSRIILVNTIQKAIEISNRYAPEHLILQVTDAEQYVTHIKHSGAVFIGPYAAETMGDYITGSNHVLPTYGYAKTYSGLSVPDFMKTISVQSVSPKGLEKLGPSAMLLAELEGLDAHKKAVAIRLACEEESI